MLNNILLLDKLDNDLMELELEPQSLVEYLCTTISLFKFMALAKKINLDLSALNDPQFVNTGNNTELVLS